MTKKDLVKNIDDLDFEIEDSDELEDLEDVSEEELQEIEELVEEPKSKKIKAASTNVKPKKEKSAKVKPKVKPKAKPKVKAKAKPKSKKPKKKNSSNKLLFFLVAVLVVLAVLVAAWFTFAPASDTEGVAAYVNGITIYESDLNDKYDVVAASSFFPVTKQDVLDSLIERELLLQKADELGITVTNADAEESLNELIAERGLTKEQIEQNLVDTGLTIDNLLDDFKNFILIDRVGNKTFKNNLSITNDELVNYLADKVFVRHILILSEEENQEIYDQLVGLKGELEEDKSVFCDYVASLSQDPGSVPNCGEYFFGRGEMVPEFEETAFALETGEFAIVKTTYGYHLIEKLQFDETIATTAKEELLAEKSNQAYLEFIDGLKESSDIEILFTDEENETDDSGFDIVTEPISNDSSEPEEIEPEIIIEEPIVNETNVFESEEVIEEPIVPEENESEELILEPEEVVEQESEELILEPEEVVEQESEEVEATEPTVKPVVTYYYSETDTLSKEITQMVNDLETQGYIDVEWMCIRVNPEDEAICIDLYGEYEYELAMSNAQDLGLEYAPTVIFDGHEYVGSYQSDDVRSAICIVAGC